MCPWKSLLPLVDKNLMNLFYNIQGVAINRPKQYVDIFVLIVRHKYGATINTNWVFATWHF